MEHEDSGIPFKQEQEDKSGDEHLSALETDRSTGPGEEPSPDDGQWDDEEGPALSEDELNAVIEGICTSKADEFRMLGYEHVQGRDIWDCVSDKYHKTGIPPLHQVVNDIFSLKVTQFMNWMTMSIYKDRPFG